jgi:hypothetical protein
MRPTLYQKRKRIFPGQLKNKSRYVMNCILSHRRPVFVPLKSEPMDDPSTRGLTREDE